MIGNSLKKKRAAEKGTTIGRERERAREREREIKEREKERTG